MYCRSLYCIYELLHILYMLVWIFLVRSCLFFCYIQRQGPECFFLPCYPSNKRGSSPVGQSEISMTGRHSHCQWISLLYMAFARQIRWTGDVSIIITLDWEKHTRVVKLCMTFESGPEWIETLFWAIYDLVLIQCSVMELCQTGLCKNPRKSASLPYPFKFMLKGN
jgi:hypothetical protein